MTNYKERLIHAGKPEYHQYFWNALRGKQENISKLDFGYNSGLGTYDMPTPSRTLYDNAVSKYCPFRRIATVHNLNNNPALILARDCNDIAQWVPEGGSINLADAMNDFTQIRINEHKLSAFIKLDEEFVRDASFDIEHYLVGRFAKNFGRAETDGFINGTDDNKPVGILHSTAGAEVGVTGAAQDTVTADEVVGLFFSVKPEYRENGVWMMNDNTAFALRTLKDSAGNYLWRSTDDTIFGRKVFITEYMPDIGSGLKPIAFGDFSYYWVVVRKPITVMPMYEAYVLNGQIGYLACELLDGKLVRSEAVKVLQMAK